MLYISKDCEVVYLMLGKEVIKISLLFIVYDLQHSSFIQTGIVRSIKAGKNSFKIVYFRLIH